MKTTTEMGFYMQAKECQRSQCHWKERSMRQNFPSEPLKGTVPINCPY